MVRGVRCCRIRRRGQDPEQEQTLEQEQGGGGTNHLRLWPRLRLRPRLPLRLRLRRRPWDVRMAWGAGCCRIGRRGQDLEQERTLEQEQVVLAVYDCGRDCECDRGCHRDCDCGNTHSRARCTGGAPGLPANGDRIRSSGIAWSCAC